jgi:hypothetical protein
MNSQPPLGGLALLVVALLPSLGVAQDCAGTCALERDSYDVSLIFFNVIGTLFGPFYALFQGGNATLLGAVWLLTDMAVLRGIFVTVMRFVKLKSQWKIDGEYVWGYVILSLLPAVWMVLNGVVMSSWAHFHPH